MPISNIIKRRNCLAYYHSHKEDRKEYVKKYCKEHQQERQEYNRKYYQSHRKEKCEYMKIRRNLPKRKLDSCMASAIYQVLKTKKAGRRWESLVGYTIEDLIKHLESKFEPWMTWDNYGEWEIDHKKPKSLFNYEIAEDIEFRKCWALENLQPLEKSANRKKHNKYNESLVL